MSIAEKKQKTLMRRRRTAIILSAALVLILAIALIFVMDFARTLTFEDVDGNTYYIRKKDGTFAMYDKDRAALPFDEQYSCYVTPAGSMIKVDAETGEWEIFAVVDTEGYEVLGAGTHVLLFPHVQKADILSLEVHNSHGSFSFSRKNEKGELDAASAFVIDQSPMTSFSQESFASLYVGAGYTLSQQKLVDPIKDANGEYTEYGLAPQTRVRTVDENGNPLAEAETYAYEPAYYILTQTNGAKHKVLIGDKLVTGKGYYAQYVELKDGVERKLPGVYVLDTTTGTHVNYAVEDYVTPMMTYPLSMNNYYDVEDFTISHRREDAVAGESSPFEDMISFTFVDLSLRQGTLLDSSPYEFELDLVGFRPTLSSIDSCLYAVYSPAFAEEGSVRVLSPTTEDLARYGLFAPVTDENGTILKEEDGSDKYVPFAPHRITFAYDVLDDQNQYSFTVEHSILISRPEDEALNPANNYFVYTALREYVKNADGTQTAIMTYSSDMIAEVQSHTLEFLNWDRGDWVNTTYISGSIAYVTQIQVNSPDYNVSFTVDNSASTPNTDGTVNTENMIVSATDSKGNQRSTFYMAPIRDRNNFLWIVTATNLQVYTVTGELRTMAEGVPYYADNKLGTQTLCRNGYIVCDGYKVEVTADYVRVYNTDANDEIVSLQAEYLRYDMELFRYYYEMLLHATIVDSYEPESEEELQKILSKEILTLTITGSDGTRTETNTYTFYEISARKAYITINGSGGFYVYRNRVDKFITDAQKFFAGEIINPTGKN